MCRTAGPAKAPDPKKAAAASAAASAATAAAAAAQALGMCPAGAAGQPPART
jgi:hypothetical protein